MRLSHVLYIQAVITALALTVVWQGSLARTAGYRQEALGRSIEVHAAEGQQYRAQVSRLTSPQRILYLVDALALGIEHSGTPPDGRTANGPPTSDRGAADARTEVATLAPRD